MIYTAPTANAVQKTLDAALLSGVTAAATLNNVVNIPNAPGIMVIDRVDSNGNPTPSKREYVAYTGTSGSTVTGLTRNIDSAGTDQDHNVGAIVEFVFDVVQMKAIKDTFETQHNTDGTHKSATVTTLKATGAEINTGTEDAKIVTPKAIADSWLNNEYSSMSRQALINGNFDVWQRGTSVSLTDATQHFQADRWMDYVDKNGGTLPTLTRSRQLQTSGDILGSYYYSRLTTNGAGTSLGTGSSHRYFERIENGVRNLCGASKKVTVSFWARSSIASKRVCVSLRQNYGTGGSPTAEEPILGTPVTLTTTWTRYTSTFTTNTLVGKTFGTANDDYLEMDIYNMWGTVFGNSYIQNGVTAETYVGSGTIDIAQVQLCAGDVALPFMPKSYEEELRACQRYCFVPNTENVYSIVSFGSAVSTTVVSTFINLPCEMRIAPSLTATYTDWNIWDTNAGYIACTGISLVAANTSKNMVFISAAVAAGLTLYRPYAVTAGAAGKKLILSAEL